MPNQKKTLSQPALNYAKEISFYRADGNNLFFPNCEISVNHNTRNQVQQHNLTQKDRSHVHSRFSRIVQQILPFNDTQSQYFKNLTNAQ